MTTRVAPLATTRCICRELTEQRKHCSSRCFCELWLFESFSEEELALLQSIGRQKIFSKGQTLFHEGSPADEMLLVKTGRIKLSKYLEDGSEVILDFRKSGELFGEHAFTDEEVFPMNATAMEETVTCGAKKADLERLILANPRVGLTMMRNLSKKMLALTLRLENMGIGDLEERLFQILVQIAKEHGVPAGANRRIVFPLTHEELGFLANAHRVSVTKALNKLLRSGRVVRDGKTYALPVSP